MSRHASMTRGDLPRDHCDHGADVAATAALFAAMAAQDAEARIAMLSAEAIQRWHLADATFWQRVKFRSRLLRAARG